MHVKLYERKRYIGYVDKPVLESVFALKHKARRQNKSVKTLYLTKEEFEDLQGEVKVIAHDINFVKLVNDQETISKLLGLPIELIEELVEEEELDNEVIDKVA